MPATTLAAAAVWGILFYTTRYVSLASMASALALPFAAGYFGEMPILVVVAALVAAFVVLRHRSNIGRLLKGTEHRFGAKKAEIP
jgi:glycerol-3-phosphate acyltransferase PlsY